MVRNCVMHARYRVDYSRTKGGSRIIVALLRKVRRGNQLPTRGNACARRASTLTSPFASLTTVVIWTLCNWANCCVAADGSSDVMAERTADLARSFSWRVDRQSDNVPRSTNAHIAIIGAMRANSTVACPRALRRWCRRTIENIGKDCVEE